MQAFHRVNRLGTTLLQQQCHYKLHYSTLSIKTKSYFSKVVFGLSSSSKKYLILSSGTVLLLGFTSAALTQNNKFLKFTDNFVFLKSTSCLFDEKVKKKTHGKVFAKHPDGEDVIEDVIEELVLTDDENKNNNSSKSNRVLQETQSKEDKKPEADFDWPQLFELIAPQWKLLTVAVCSAFAVAIINIQIPHLLGQLVDIVTKRLIETNDHVKYAELETYMKEPVLKLISLYGAQAIATFTYIVTLSMVGERMALDLRSRLFTSIIHQDIVFFDTHMTGEIVNRLTSDVSEFKSSFKSCISQGLRSVSQTIGCLVSLYMISPQMTSMTGVIIPVIIAIGSLFGAGLRKLSRKAQAQQAKATTVGEEAISNIRTVRAFSMEDSELQMYTQELRSSQSLYENLGIGIGIFQSGSNLFLNGIVLSVMYIGGRLIVQHQMSGGDLMSFLVAAQTMQRSLTNLSLLFGQFVRGLGAGSRVFEYINLAKDNNNNNINYDQQHEKMMIDLKNFKGDIEFRNVNFSYPTRPEQTVINSMNLTIPAGKVIALVGSSGCGKSTIISLLEKFYSVDKEEILIDGVPLDKVDGKFLRGHVIGLINQEPILFATSVMENIRYGNPDATNDEVIEAARKANALGFIQEFPLGFNTIVGERGVTVSGGQKQRIAIARAIIKNPKILILDEATSALDTESERIVQDTLDCVVKGKTVLVIAHRLSTVQNADLIAVIHKGCVAEIGTHQELIKRHGLYYKLVKHQELQ